MSLLLVMAIWYAYQYLQPVVIRSPLTWIMAQPLFGLIAKGKYLMIAYSIVKLQKLKLERKSKTKNCFHLTHLKRGDIG